MTLADEQFRTLTMMPFVPYVVLIGNAIGTSSKADMLLLDAVIQLMRPLVPASPLVRNICSDCESLYWIAATLVA